MKTGLSIATAILLIGALAVGLASPYTVTQIQAPAPAIHPLDVLGSTARSEAERTRLKDFATLDGLASRAAAKPILLRSNEWRDEWTAVWISIYLNNEGELHYVAETCLANSITPVSPLDLLECTKKTNAVINPVDRKGDTQ